MEERRYDGSAELSDSVTPEMIEKALADIRNKVVAVHREGSVVVGSNGRFYRCNELGQWVRVRSNDTTTTDTTRAR
jgi:hypothetical protein